MKKPIYFSIAAVSLVFGLLIAFQFRTTSSIAGGVPVDRFQELTIEKKQVELDNAHLEQEAADLAAKIEEAKKGRSQASEVLESELSKIRMYAGLTPLSGPGVEVIMENPPDKNGGASFYSIRDEDILKVINDLRGAGAEAMSINGQRILATSEIRLAGNHINVNLVRLSPPYHILAIGNPGTLKSSLEIKGGFVEYLSANGITVAVQQREKIEVPAYNGSLKFDYAKAAQRG
ncbi:DUF881 domain-containing protein [Pelotomaculum propionicicum]|uniref:Division initiation protein n=1 Tax=Pelotomaculum propionicicum TaxID=258475 RepID=A0A4Y7RWJ5_9FIRM|nr:DUF881 domain-containing protein [Pelotomaculum propionicicum]NLI12900.1 DUF881 domain-containing protein [Peptococcaceae bacterium]TEB13140.1 hypothetical protein Pmgp_00436 [Pelotomaculum propionicicum]